jgi:transposase
MYQYRHAINRMRLGESDRAIAKAGVMGRKKLAALRQLAHEHGWLVPENALPEDDALARVVKNPTQGPTAQGSLVLPYRDDVKSWAEQGIYATTIHEALIRKHGFSGSYSSVRRYLHSLGLKSPKATTILDFQPGEAAQIDFGTGPKITDAFTGEIFSTWFFVMTLAWSRHMYAEIVRNQKVETWLSCHRRAFEFFNGIPAKLIIDNPKCAITKACYHDPVVQRSYGDAAEEYGFIISPCPPRSPEKKGRVESGVKYLKRSFMPLREFRDLRDANQQLIGWVLENAGNRIHGTTKQRPLERFDSERHMLKALPDVPPELAFWAKVKLHGTCHVAFEKCFYSAPYPLVRKHLWLKANGTTVKIFHNYELVAVHPRKWVPGQRSTVQDHLPPNALAYAMQDPQWCLQQAGHVGEACLKVIHSLFSQGVIDNLRSAQGIISLEKKFGAGRLEAACLRALAFDNPRYTAVKSILKKGLDQIPVESHSFELTSETYTGAGRFSRNIASMLSN